MNDVTVTFPGGGRVNADIDGWRISTDQSAKNGGDGSAPEPFDYFLASMGACAGAYIQGFCRNRDIDTTGIILRQRVTMNPESHLPETIRLAIEVPPDFPNKYLPALERVAAKCKVKKTIEAPVAFEMNTTVVAADAAVGQAA